jgi:predicted component of type VI protein secretion system
MRALYVLLLTALFIGCSQSEKIPADVLQPEQLKQVFFDLYLADAVNTDRKLRDTSLQLQSESKRDFLRVLELHGLNPKTFQKSFDYYKKHPQLMKRVTDSLAAFAARRSAEILTDTTKRNLNGSNIQDTARQVGN